MNNHQPTGYICPSCGYDDLPRPAYGKNDIKNGTPSFEICPSCWLQFGFDDDDQNITHEQWRNQWIDKGMPWQSKGIKPPPDWDPRRQLLNVGVKV